MYLELLEEITANLSVIEEGRRFNKNYKDGEIAHSDSFFGDVRYNKESKTLKAYIINHDVDSDVREVPIDFFKDFTDKEYSNIAKLISSALAKNKEIKKFIANQMFKKDDKKSRFQFLKGLYFLGIDVISDDAHIDMWYSNGDFDAGAIVSVNKQLKYTIKREI